MGGDPPRSPVRQGVAVRSFCRTDAERPEEDALAPLADVGTILDERLPRLGNALVSGTRRSAVVLETSPLNPRRPPWTFCFALFSGTGVLLMAFPHRGLSTRPRTPFAGLALAPGVVAGYVLLGRYLGLIRHEQNEVLAPPR